MSQEIELAQCAARRTSTLFKQAVECQHARRQKISLQDADQSICRPDPVQNYNTLEHIKSASDRMFSSSSSDHSTAFAESDCPTLRSFDSMRSDSSGTSQPSQSCTCVIRNIPVGYTRDLLLQMLDRYGFKGSYDFVYLPLDFRTKQILGHALVNLVSLVDAFRLRDSLHGSAEWVPCCDKKCEVILDSPLQGFQAHVDRYRNSPVMHENVPDEFKPIIFVDGRRAPFPAPTKTIRSPNQWRQRHAG